MQRLFTTRTETTTEHWRRHERTTTDVVVRRGHPRAPRVREGGTAAGTRLAPSGIAPARFRPPRPSRTRVPRSHLTALLLSPALLLRQTASTHLREGLLALCPGGGDAATLHDIIEACDAEHRRLGGDLANATDEDVRLFALFSTAAKCFLCRAWREADGVRARAPDDALVSRVVRRVWLPLLADDIRSDTADRTDRSIDHGTRRQVIDECVAALRWLNGAGDVARRATTKTLARVFFPGETPPSGTVGGSDGDADEPEFGAMRFEDAVELAAALFACAANSPANGAAEEGTLARALGTRDESQGGRTGFGFFSRVSVEASKTLVYIARLDVEGMDATRWRRVLACLAPAAIDVCERHGAEYLKNNTLVSAREDFRDEVFSRVWRMMKADGAEMDGSKDPKDDPERASDDFEAFEAYWAPPAYELPPP